jgi:uncharacterized OB-fold protein
MTASQSRGYRKPLPALRGVTAEWYGWLSKHELRFQRCTECQLWRHVPRELCPHCGSQGWEWARSQGRGTVFTWTTTYRPLHPAFVETPFAQVVVELDEGPRMITEVVDVAADALEIGMRVVVVFDEVTPEVTLAKFRQH